MKHCQYESYLIDQYMITQVNRRLIVKITLCNIYKFKISYVKVSYLVSGNTSNNEYGFKIYPVSMLQQALGFFKQIKKTRQISSFLKNHPDKFDTLDKLGLKSLDAYFGSRLILFKPSYSSYKVDSVIK